MFDKIKSRFMARAADFIEEGSELRAFILLNVIRVLQIALCACFLGAGISGLMLSGGFSARAQSTPFSLDTQVARNSSQISDLTVALAQQKISVMLYEREIASLEANQKILIDQVSNLRDQVAMMHGIGIAIGAVLMVLTFLQLWFGGKLLKPTTTP